MKYSRLLYFGYYVKKLNWQLFRKFLTYTKNKTGRNTLSICMSIFHDSLKYNISSFDFLRKMRRKKINGPGLAICMNTKAS